MTAQTLNRFEWLKAVNCSGLLPRAKIVAVALAVTFFNDDTGQLNPGVEMIAEAAGSTIDTVKRAIRDLINGGWLDRTEGRGRGNMTRYTLLSPGKIIRLSRPKKGADMPQEKGGTSAPLERNEGTEKGAPVHGKGGTRAPSYIEQSLEQKGRAWQAFEKYRFAGNWRDGPTYLCRKRNWHELNQWGEWLRKRNMPKLCQMPISEKGVFALPYRHPPTDAAQCDEALSYFATMIDLNGARHAAQ